jgi:hypothetical protein
VLSKYLFLKIIADILSFVSSHGYFIEKLENGFPYIYAHATILTDRARCEGLFSAPSIIETNFLR